MTHKQKLDLIRSLNLGDVVITGNHIGALRYLGSLEGPTAKHDKNRIFELYAGIELTEPNGHMNGTMIINGKTITYFTTTYGNNIKKKRRKKRRKYPNNNNNHNDDMKHNETINDDDNNHHYGILIPAVTIQNKINPFNLLKKITMIFEQYKSVKKRLNFYKQFYQQQMDQNEQSFKSQQSHNNEIKTNSDLISTKNHSPSTTYGIQHRNLNRKTILRSETNSTLKSYNNNHPIPISQPSIILNSYSTITMPANDNESRMHRMNDNNDRNLKKWRTTPTFSMNKLKENHQQYHQKNTHRNTTQININNNKYNHNQQPQQQHQQRYNMNNNNNNSSKGVHYNNHNMNTNGYNSYNNHSQQQQQHLNDDQKRIPLRKIASAPHPYRSEFAFGDNPSHHDSPHDSSQNEYGWDVSHQHSHTIHHFNGGTQSNRLFVPNSTVTTPHITNSDDIDDINNADFTSMTNTTTSPHAPPILNKFAKSHPIDTHSKLTTKNVTIVTSVTPTMPLNDHNKQQLISSLPSPIRKKRHRGYSYHHGNYHNYHIHDSSNNESTSNNSNNNNNNIQSRQRGYSYQSYTSRKAIKTSPSPKLTPSPCSGPMAINSGSDKNKLNISLTTPQTSRSPQSGPVSPATVVINEINEIKTENELKSVRDISGDTEMISNTENEASTTAATTTPNIQPIPDIVNIANNLSNNKKPDKPTEIVVAINPSKVNNHNSSSNNLPKTVLSPENSQQSNVTDNTISTSRARTQSGHHPSASMYTHAPLNCWNDSNKNDKLTSSGGSADKDNDLSSLAIKVSSPRHATSASANFIPRDAIYPQNKMRHIHVANQDSMHLKELLADLKKTHKIKTIQPTKNNINNEELTILQEIDDTNIDKVDNMIAAIDNNTNNTVNTTNTNNDSQSLKMGIVSDDESTSTSTSSSTSTSIDDGIIPQLIDNNTTTATVHSPAVDVLDNMVTYRQASSPEEKLAEVENNDDEKQPIIPPPSKSPLSPIEMMSDIATPIPKEAAINGKTPDFNVVDNNNNDIEAATNNNNNNIEENKDISASPPTTILTAQSLRKHNKRRASREQLQFPSSCSNKRILRGAKSDNNNNKNKIKKFGRLHHHHHQTLSEPMLPKFALMTIDSSDDEKSGSSDGEDRQSLGMDIHINDINHTNDITDDDPQLMDNILLKQIPIQQQKSAASSTSSTSNISRSNRLFSPTFTPDSISPSRRSSVILTSGVWEYMSPKDPIMANAAMVSPDSIINYNNGQLINFNPNGATGNTSSTPTYSSYKTRHQYLRDMSYFNTLHRAQQFKRNKIKSKVEERMNNHHDDDDDDDDNKNNDNSKHVTINSRPIRFGIAASNTSINPQSSSSSSSSSDDINNNNNDDDDDIDESESNDTDKINEREEEKADSPSLKHQEPFMRHNSITSLDIIQEKYDNTTDDNDNNNDDDDDDDKKEEESDTLQIEINNNDDDDDEEDEEEEEEDDDKLLILSNDRTDDTISNADDNDNDNADDADLHRHRAQLSCDTRAAIQGGIEPYQPPKNKENDNNDNNKQQQQEKDDDDDDDVVVVDYPIHQSAMV